MFSVLKYFRESNFGENCEGAFCCRTALIHYKWDQCNMENRRVLTVNLNPRIDTRHPLAAIWFAFLFLSLDTARIRRRASEYLNECFSSLLKRDRVLRCSVECKSERHAVSSLSDSACLCSLVAMSTSHLVIITRSPCFVWQPSCICCTGQHKTWEMAGQRVVS